jgi:hypothetical protein
LTSLLLPPHSCAYFRSGQNRDLLCSALPSLLTCLYNFAHILGWANLENVAIGQRGMLAEQLYNMIHVPRLKDEYSAEFVSAQGPSVVATLPFFQYRVKAVSAG